MSFFDVLPAQRQKMTNQCATWEFRMSEAKTTKEEILVWLKDYAKHYVFQLEKGDTGYKHYQGSFSLVKKRRKTELLKLLTVQFEHLAPLSTTSLQTNSFNYFMKKDTRIDGPWDDQQKEVYIPRQYRDINLYSWQQEILDMSKDFSIRYVNVLYNPTGNIGKTTLASIAELQHNSIDLPPVNDYKELIQVMCDICMAKETRNPSIVFIDMPRALDKTRLYGLYCAAEQIKKGKLYDMRYHYKEWWIDSPSVWIFTNLLPDLDMLSPDRFKIWTVQDLKLIPYVL